MFLGFLKSLSFRVIGIAILVGIVMYIYFNYSIVNNGIIEQYEMATKEYEKIIKQNEIKIKNLKTEISIVHSKLDVCKFEKEVDEYLNDMGDDYENPTIDDSSNYIPF